MSTSRLSAHVFGVLANMIKDYLVADLSKLYGKPFWSNQLKCPEKSGVEEESRIKGDVEKLFPAP